MSRLPVLLIPIAVLSVGLISSIGFADEVKWRPVPKACEFALTPGYQSEFSEEHVVQRLSMIESFWEKVFAERGWPFEEVRIMTFKGSVPVGNQTMTPESSPGYSPITKTIYISTDFEMRLKKRIGPLSDSLLTVILAHEFGHHIQVITGSNNRGVEFLSQQHPNDNQAILGAFFPAIEKQADCLAGVFFHHLREEGLAAPSEIADAMTRMLVMGDDFQALIRLLKRDARATTGTAHASGSERSAWFNKGMESGDPRACETFAIPVFPQAKI